MESLLCSHRSWRMFSPKKYGDPIVGYHSMVAIGEHMPWHPQQTNYLGFT